MRRKYVAPAPPPDRPGRGRAVIAGVALALLAGAAWLVVHVTSSSAPPAAGGSARTVQPSRFPLMRAAAATPTPTPVGTDFTRLYSQLAGQPAGRPKAAGATEPKRAAPLLRKVQVHRLVEGLRAPDGLAVQPETGLLFVSEEDAGRVMLWRDGLRVAIDAQTPVVRGNHRLSPLTSPEGIAFAPDGRTLYVAEDYPGGRLIAFAWTNGHFTGGTVVEIPGGWKAFAWESVAVGPAGELLLAGSNMEAVTGRDPLAGFTGVVLYRDPNGAWWVPYERLFSSLSAVVFTKSGRQAAFACEFSGDIGWIDLTSHQVLVGHSDRLARAPESLCVLPDGTFLVAEEGGTVMLMDPAANTLAPLVRDLGGIETVAWDSSRQRALVTADGKGEVLALEFDPGWPDRDDAMQYAAFYPAYTPRHIPTNCPAYLANMLAMANIKFDCQDARQPSFRQFTRKVPLIAADAVTRLESDPAQVADPVERFQFAVFFPKQALVDRRDESVIPFAVMAARTRTGTVIRSSLMKVESHIVPFTTGRAQPFNLRQISVPQAANVEVSDAGVATIQLLGLGRTPDFALVLNPRNPFESYLVVQPDDERVDRYRLELPPAADSNLWVVAAMGQHGRTWQALSAPTPTPTPGASGAR